MKMDRKGFRKGCQKKFRNEMVKLSVLQLGRSWSCGTLALRSEGLANSVRIVTLLGAKAHSLN